MALKESFRKWQVDHPNFMTPHVVSLQEKGNLIIEISSGTGFDRENIYGVSLFQWNGATFNNMHGWGQMFHSLKQARAYANSL